MTLDAGSGYLLTVDLVYARQYAASAFADTMEQKQLKEVDNSDLSIDNFQDVYQEVVNLAAHWRNMCTALGLSPSEESEIARENANEQGNCLREVLKRWLKKTYDTKKYGNPTWRNLVKTVANAAGGNNPALAEKIAKNHPLKSKKAAPKRPKADSTSTASPAPKRAKIEQKPKPKESLSSSSKKKPSPQQRSEKPSIGEKSKPQPAKSIPAGKPATAKTKTAKAKPVAAAKK